MQNSLDSFIFPEKLPRCYEKTENYAYYREDHFSACNSAYAHKKDPENTLLYSGMLSEYKALYPSYHVRLSQQFLEILRIIDGNMILRSNDSTFIVEAGEIAILHKGMDHRFLPGPATYYSAQAILISGPSVDAIVKTSNFKSKTIVKMADVSRFESRFFELFKIMRNIATEDRDDHISSLCFEILHVINTREKILEYPQKMKNLLAFIQEKNGNLSLAELAEKARCSIPTLTKLFQSNLNDTPHKYLIRWKMNRALNMLISGECSIKEVAVQSGYNSPFNFSTEFKKHFGFSPRTYLRKLKDSLPCSAQKS